MRSPPDPWVKTDAKGNPKKTDIEMLVLVSKDLEHRLHTELGAQGNSLGERMRWCRAKQRPGGRPMLSAGLEKKLDMVKGWRNLVVHEWGVDTISDEDRATLVRIYKEIRNTLKQIAAQIKASGAEGPSGEDALPLSSRVRDKDHPNDVGIVVDSCRGPDGAEEMQVAFPSGTVVVAPEQVEIDATAELLEEGARFVLRKNSPREPELRGLVGVIKSVSEAGAVTAEFQESPMPDWTGQLADCEGVVGTGHGVERVRVGSPVRRAVVTHADSTPQDESAVGTVRGRAVDDGRFKLVVDFPGEEGKMIDPRQLEIHPPGDQEGPKAPRSPNAHEGEPPRADALESGASRKAAGGGGKTEGTQGGGEGPRCWGGHGAGGVGGGRPCQTAADEGRSGVAGARPGEQAGLLRVGAKVRVHEVAIYLPGHDKAGVTPARTPRASVGPLLQVRKICGDGLVEVSFNDPALGQLSWKERAENLEVVVGPRGPRDGVSQGTQIRRRKDAAGPQGCVDEVGRVVGSTIKPTGSYALLADFGNGEAVSVSPVHVEVEPCAPGSVVKDTPRGRPPVSVGGPANGRKSGREGGCSPELAAMQAVEQFEAFLNARGTEKIGQATASRTPRGGDDSGMSALREEAANKAGEPQVNKAHDLGIAKKPSGANACADQRWIGKGVCALKSATAAAMDNADADRRPWKGGMVCSPKSAANIFLQGSASMKTGAETGANTNRSIGGSTVDGSDVEGRPMDGQFNDTEGNSGASRLDTFDMHCFKLDGCRRQNVA
ncbi:unnamed protein product [Ostreobium quekettii]|uniref:Uncharacterized protein n=1 Tax=Ostreobium quekettii TaxID=121088 RepID=A0A8S1IZC6_9CHLO|nr:unnamed protein product [Ostreobium quekettii]